MGGFEFTLVYSGVTIVSTNYLFPLKIYVVTERKILCYNVETTLLVVFFARFDVKHSLCGGKKIPVYQKKTSSN